MGKIQKFNEFNISFEDQLDNDLGPADSKHELKELTIQAGIEWMKAGLPPDLKDEANQLPYYLRDKAKGAIGFVTGSKVMSDIQFTLRPSKTRLDVVQLILTKNAIFSGQIFTVRKDDVVQCCREIATAREEAHDPIDRYKFNYKKAHKDINDVIEKYKIS